VYLQARACPAHLEPLDYDPPALNRVSAPEPFEARPAPVRVARKGVDIAKRERRCEKLKRKFHAEAGCGTIAACRSQHARREALREDYKAGFCALYAGSIGSRPR